MQAPAVLALLIGSLAIRVVNGHESAVNITFGKALELATEESCARVTTPILIDDVPAQIGDFLSVADEVAISVSGRFNLDSIICRPHIETSRRDDVIGRQFRQIGTIDPVKNMKIDGAPLDRAGASPSIDNTELDSQRLIIGPFAMIAFEDADGVHDQERPMRGEKFLARQLKLLPYQRSLVSGEKSQFLGAEGQTESGDGECDGADRYPRLWVERQHCATSNRQITDRDAAIVGAQFVVGLILFGLLAAAWYDWLERAGNRDPRTKIDHDESKQHERGGDQGTP